MKHRISRTLLIAILVAFAAGGTGFAASRYIITSKQQIAPWVRAELHGARGPRGFTGPQGPAGPTADPATAPRYTTVEQTVTIPAGQQVGVAVPCASKQATGGGFNVPDGVSVLTSEPLASPSGWLFGARNTTSSNQIVRFSVVCAS